MKISLQKKAPQGTVSSRPVKQLLHRGAALALVLGSNAAISASIEGLVVDSSGQPLSKVAVCLADPDEAGRCLKIRSTGKSGKYSFTGLKAGNQYTVLVNGDRTAASRKFQSYSTYVWKPLQQRVDISARNTRATLDDFTGKFNFSNFQRVVNLTAADFPELASIDLEGSYVALKVFIPSKVEDEPPQTIYLGQVTSTANVQIAASVPLAEQVIEYEIFSATLSINGSIALAGS